MGKRRYFNVPFVANSTPNVVNVLQDVVNLRPVAGELSRRLYRRVISTGAMLDRLPSTFMGQ